MSLFGPPNIEKMKARHDVKGLIKVLGYKQDSRLRTKAARELGAIGDLRAVEPLIATLRDEHWDVRWAAIDGLALLGDPRGVVPLIAALDDSSYEVRKAAADGLGQLHDSRATEPLIRILKHNDGSHLIEAAVRALDRIGWKPSNDEIGAMYWIAKDEWDRCVPIGAAAVEPLIAALNRRYLGGSDPTAKRAHEHVQNRAMRALGQIGDARAVEPLLNALNIWEVRFAAAEALGQIGDLRALEPLIDRLEYASEARDAVARFGEPAIKLLLVRLMRSGSQEVATTLWKAGWRPSQDESGAAYWIAKQDWDKCLAIGSPAVKLLLTSLRSSNRDIRKAAARTLVNLYRSEILDQTHKELILAARAQFPQNEHEDIPPKHWDDGEKGRSCHDDSMTRHQDQNFAGVDFPL